MLCLGIVLATQPPIPAGLKDLKARNYALTCQDSGVLCETTVTASDLIREYVTVKALMKSSFS
jgi:hypothetical protein